MPSRTRLDLPFRQARGDGGRRSLTQLLVIHATDNLRADNPATKVDEAAENEAGYASHRADEISAHVYIDDDSAVQGVPLDHIAYGCYPTGNARSIQLELAGRSGKLSPGTIARAARIAATICPQWKLPITKVDAGQARRGLKGICGHADVTQAWHTGRDAGANHTDPGTFPWASFLQQIRAALPHAVLPPPPVQFDSYRLIAGDRLDLLSRTFYGDASRVAQLRTDNHLIGQTVTPGQVLRVRRPHKPVHVVAAGDTAWALSTRFNVRMSTLADLNQHRVADLAKINPGLILRVG